MLQKLTGLGGSTFQTAVRKALQYDTSREWWAGLTRRQREMMLKTSSKEKIEVDSLFAIIKARFRETTAVLGAINSLGARPMEELVEDGKQKGAQKKRISDEFFGMKEGRRKPALTRQQDQPGARKLTL